MADKISGRSRNGVDLTSTNLQQVEAWTAELPDVDRARVGAVRQRVESGAYEINAERLANRLLAFERDIARRRSKHC